MPALPRSFPSPAEEPEREFPSRSRTGAARESEGYREAAEQKRSEVDSEPVMTGTFFHQLDDKNRIIVPTKLRAALTERFWLMLDESDNIAMYNQETGRDVLVYCERLMAQNPDDEAIAAAVERICGAAELVKVDGETYRVPLPEILRYHAKIDREVVTVGNLNRAVVWSRERWVEAQNERLQSPEIRRAQASMLRAAACGNRLPPAGEDKADDNERRTGTTGTGAGVSRGSAGTGAFESGREAIASAGDGVRGSRVLTLQDLGRRG